MAENENQETNMSFKLSLMKVTQLSFPIASLCDSEFNPEGFGLLEFSDTGLDITVRNTLASAELFLLPTSGLTDYHCKNPILGKIININPIYRFLIEAIHHHSPNPSLHHIILTVFHLHGSNKLTFTYGSPPIKKEIRWKESNGEFERIPAIVEFNCEAHLNSTIMRLMIRNVQQRHDRLVLVRITKELFTIHLGTGNFTVFETKPIDKDCSVRILTEDEQEHHALFQMLHLEAMKKAANAGLKFYLRFLTKPENHIMIRYNLQQLGFFVFLQKAVLIVPMPKKPPPKPPQQPPPTPPQQPPPKPPQQPPQIPPHEPLLYKPPRKAPRRKKWCRDYDRVVIQ